jgi:signal peptidase II
LFDLKEIKNKFLSKENFYFLIIILILFFLDRYLKFNIINNFSDSVYYINDFINVDLVWNTGIGFGLFSSGSTLIYNIITFIIGIVILILISIFFKLENYEKIIFSIIIGGALGNFYDRLVFKGVPDFIDIHYGNFHWFTFNLADIFITIGIIAFLLKDFLIKKKK